MREIIVIKQNIQEVETWRYSGQVLHDLSNGVLLEARFNRDNLPFLGEELRRNDRFIELFLTNQWFNIFEIHDRDDDHLKLWYCNVARPAQLKNSSVSYVDLALDLAVFPDGRRLILDEDEFSALEITPEERQIAYQAMDNLKEIFSNPQTFNLENWALRSAESQRI